MNVVELTKTSNNMTTVRAFRGNKLSIVGSYLPSENYLALQVARRVSVTLAPCILQVREVDGYIEQIG